MSITKEHYERLVYILSSVATQPYLTKTYVHSLLIDPDAAYLEAEKVKPRRMSVTGVTFLRKWEGAKTHLYLDSAGLPTIGVGHLLSQSEIASGKIIIEGEPVKYRNGLSTSQVDALLKQDLRPRESFLVSSLARYLPQHRFDMLVSLCFNIGTKALAGSTLYRLVNEGDFDGAHRQFERWVWAGGKRLKGLENRRAAEADIWQNGYRSSNPQTSLFEPQT